MIDVRYKARLDAMVRSGEARSMAEALEIMLARAVFFGPNRNERKEFLQQIQTLKEAAKVLLGKDLD